MNLFFFIESTLYWRLQNLIFAFYNFRLSSSLPLLDLGDNQRSTAWFRMPVHALFESHGIGTIFALSLPRIIKKISTGPWMLSFVLFEHLLAALFMITRLGLA